MSASMVAVMVLLVAVDGCKIGRQQRRSSRRFQDLPRGYNGAEHRFKTIFLSSRCSPVRSFCLRCCTVESCRLAILGTSAGPLTRQNDRPFSLRRARPHGLARLHHESTRRAVRLPAKIAAPPPSTEPARSRLIRRRPRLVAAQIVHRVAPPRPPKEAFVARPQSPRPSVVAFTTPMKPHPNLSRDVVTPSSPRANLQQELNATVRALASAEEQMILERAHFKEEAATARSARARRTSRPASPASRRARRLRSVLRRSVLSPRWWPSSERAWKSNCARWRRSG